MNSLPNLRVDWCAHAAAKYAVEHWHYSRSMPSSKNVYFGIWENKRFVGALIFTLGSGGATDGRRFGLRKAFECAELGRVALRDHAHTVSKMVAIAMRLLKAQSPGLRLLVSYADPYHGHHGGIYQAMNWVYIGRTSSDKGYLDGKGKMHHSRVVSTSGWKKHFGVYKRCMRPVDAVRVVALPGKHQYLYPLDALMRERIQPLSKPYPKRRKDSSEPSAIHAEEGGAAPTPALQLENEGA